MTVPVKRIQDLAEVIMGTSPKGHTYNETGDGMPLLNGPTEFGDNHPQCSLFTTASVKECEPNDLIFCVRGSTTGRMNWADKVYSLGRGVCAIRGKTEMDTKFIRYCLDYRLSALLKLAGGTTFPNLPQNTIKNFEIPTPSNRREIASILSTYDDLIENNRRRMKLLEEAAQLLYREWFIHLRFPGHERTHTVVGIPEGWKRIFLGEHVTLNYGKALKAEMRVDGPFPVYGSSGVVGSHERALAKGPGIILGRKGNVGSVFWCSNDFYPIDTVYFIDDENSNLYLYYALKHMHFISTDVAVPGLNRDFAYSRPFFLPPNTILRQFLELVSTMHEQKDHLERINTRLKAARDLLLPRLMNGEIMAPVGKIFPKNIIGIAMTLID